MFSKFSFTLFWAVLFCATGLMRPVFTEGQQSGKTSDINTLRGDVAGAFAQMDQASKTSDMTPEDEYFLGRAVAAEIIKAYKPYTANPALTAYLNKICQAIVVNSVRPTLFSGYHVEILDTEEICAFASPGGHIFMGRGLIDSAPSEDALAAVIAHEVAHIQLRHAVTIIQNERTVQDLSAAAERAATIVARNLTTQERAVLFRESLSVSINILFRDGYSQEQEFQADRMARLLLIGAGYDPAALGEILQILEKKTKTGNMSKTHPSPAIRITSLGNLPGSVRTGTGRETLSVRRPRFNSAFRR